jgi:hypothetical protein
MKNRLAVLVTAVQLKDALCNVQTNCRNIGLEFLAFVKWWLRFHFGTSRCRREGEESLPLGYSLIVLGIYAK